MSNGQENGNKNSNGGPISLFDYTEEQLLEEEVLTYYQILNLEQHASSDGVKKAYRKASLKYHPDKTGRGDDDYVFLAVKKAYDVLSDHAKRSAYDSTNLPFDDSVPAARSDLLQDPLLLYKDEDFYGLFGPVFERNLRFDANLRPDAPGVAKKKKQNNNNNNASVEKNFRPPTLGDDDTPMEQVHKFYEYWIHFDSWRDFTAQAADELQVEQELENAESRYEKRWLQKEVDKRAKQLKTKENGRIQTLVDRAMEADPRLRRERQEKQEAKERAKAERAAAAERKRQEEAAARLEAERLEEEEKDKRAQEKAAREQGKKLIRKERQQLRRMTSSSFAAQSSASSSSSAPVWADSYDMNVDVDYLCNNLNLEELKSLNEQYEHRIQQSASETDAQHDEALKMIRERALQAREAEKAGTSNTNSQTTSGATLTERKEPQAQPKSGKPWTKEELSALAKAVKKYPPGGASRWDQIALFVNNICKQSEPRSKEECIQKYNDASKSAPKDNATTTTTPAAPAAASVVEPSSNGGSTTTTTATPATNGDAWTAEQDAQLQNALAKFPASMEKNARWSAIAEAVPGKTKKQCVQRFKAIREALKSK